MTKTKRLWKCPTCARRFAKKNQWHSCDAQSISRHFRDKDPEVLRIYELLVSLLRKLGPLRIDAVKTSINFASKYHFGGVAARKNYLRLGFLSEGMIDDERIGRTERLGPKRFHQSVVLRSPADLDGTIMGWLGNAYKLQSR